MKIVLLMFAFVVFIIKANCQTPENATLTKADYLKKYTNQKTAAWVLLGGGFALAVGGSILDASSDWTKSETPYIVTIFTGCASMIGSIPLFISAHKNKKRAASLTVNNQNFLLLQQRSVCRKMQPAITLKMNL